MVRAHIDAIEHAALLGKQRLEAAEDCIEIVKGDVAAGDLRAVGDGDRHEAVCVRVGDSRPGARDERDVIRFERAARARLLVEHAVDVEEDRRALVGVGRYHRGLTGAGSPHRKSSTAWQIVRCPISTKP